MTNEQLAFLFENNIVVHDASDAEQEIVDLAGYQVTKSELFSHASEPAITIWQNRIKFSMACLRKFPNVKYIQILIHPEQRRLIIRPCDPNTPDSLRWAKGGGEKELRNRDLLCKIFAGKVFELMNWNVAYRYKVLGKPVVCDSEALLLFQLCDFELFVAGKSRQSYLPIDWRNYFGVPIEDHVQLHQINLADGYISTDNV